MSGEAAASGIEAPPAQPDAAAPRGPLAPWTPPLVIILLGLLFFAPLLFAPAGVLYSDYSDFINYHIPCKAFLVRSWQQTGELPRWCPEMFAGMPFLHDPQVAAFYPLHLPLYGLPAAHIGAGCSWLIVLHVILAGLCMYGYGRWHGLGIPGALVAGVGYMFAGKWLLHLLVGGHFNVAPLALLPLLLLLLEGAIQTPQRRRSAWQVGAAAAVFAAIILGTHPQFTFYVGLFGAGWTLVTGLADLPAAERRPFWFRWVAVGLTTALLAAALSAVQIVPALEATRHSSRTLGTPIDGAVIGNAVLSLLGLVGPAVTTESGWLWENRTGLGLLWLVLAASAPWLAPSRTLRWQWGMVLVWLALGLGGVIVLQWVPGFHLWRLYSRMLMLLALPVALFAGRSVDALLASGVTAAQRAQCRALLVKLACFVLGPLALYAALLAVKGRDTQLALYWPSLLLSLPLAWWLLGREARPSAALAAGWLALLLVDLWALAWPLVQVRDEAALYAPSASVRYLAERRDERGRILDISHINPADGTDRAPACATPLWPNCAMIAGVEPVRGYNPLDVLRTKEYLQFVMDSAEPLRALHNFTLPGPGGFPIRNQALADLLGIRFLLLPSAMPLEGFVTDPAARQNAWSPVFTDPTPHAYSFVPREDGRDAGLIDLPEYTVYENRGVLPRALVVHAAEPLPAADALATLKRTPFRERVLLEGLDWPPSHAAPAEPAVAVIQEYTPNRVLIAATSGAPGYLVLNDPWFPGWSCTIDGEATPIYRANFLFRAVALPAGAHEVVFTCAPPSYALGLRLSLATLAVLLGGSLLLGALALAGVFSSPRTSSE